MPATRAFLNSDAGEEVMQQSYAQAGWRLSLFFAVNAWGAPATQARIARICKQRGIAFGAHPAAPKTGSLRASLYQQIGGTRAIALSEGVKMSHVKPHGRLYHACAKGGRDAEVLIEAVRSLWPSLRLVAPAGSSLVTLAKRRGLRVWTEGFADRRYRTNGTLVPRSQRGALIRNPAEAAAQAEALALGRAFSARGGTARLPPVDTVCIHGNTPGAHAIALAARQALRGIR